MAGILQTRTILHHNTTESLRRYIPTLRHITAQVLKLTGGISDDPHNPERIVQY